MSIDEFKTSCESVQSILTSIAIAAGGFWTYWKFVWSRENRPKIEFNISLNEIGALNEKIIVEIIATIENKGIARHWISEFTVDVFYLTSEDEVKLGSEKINGQVEFRKLNPEKIYLVPKKWDGSFIDSGIKQDYTYLYYVPEKAKYVTISSQFKYAELKSDFHTAQRTFRLEKKWEGNEKIKMGNPAEAASK
jgi:hypothetical protein